jgi:hypothetical protein
VDEDEIDRRLEEVLGPRPTQPRVTSLSLDDLLASRTHVRVMRVLVALGDDINLTAGDVARRANASNGRVLEVLRQLTSLAMMQTHWTPSHAIHRLAEEHPLTQAIRFLFDEERRAAIRTSP